MRAVPELAAADHAWRVHCQVIEARQRVERSFLELARLVREVRDQRLYRVLGYDTFEAWLVAPEINLSRTVGYRLIAALEAVERHQIPEPLAVEIGVSRLELIAPALESVPASEREIVLHDAKELSYRDLRARVRERRGEDTSELALLRQQVADELRRAASVCLRCESLAAHLDSLIAQLMLRLEYARLLEAERSGDSE